MKKKVFGLSGILKIRKYRESLALVEFQKRTQEDRNLAMKYENLNSEIEKNISKIKNFEAHATIDELENLYKYIAYCNSQRKEILAQREAIRPQVEKAKEDYNQVRLELESIKILEEAHNTQQKKIEKKIFYEQIQEGVILK